MSLFLFHAEDERTRVLDFLASSPLKWLLYVGSNVAMCLPSESTWLVFRSLLLSPSQSLSIDSPTENSYRLWVLPSYETENWSCKLLVSIYCVVLFYFSSGETISSKYVGGAELIRVGTVAASGRVEENAILQSLLGTSQGSSAQSPVFCGCDWEGCVSDGFSHVEQPAGVQKRFAV